MRPFKIEDGKSPKRKLPNGAQLGLVDDTGNYLLDAPVVEKAYMTRFLVQATLPHTDPGDIPLWSRASKYVKLSIQTGYGKDDKPYGIPYGSIPRLLLLWITTEALRTKSRDLYLGRSMCDFVERIGITRTGGRGGGITAFKRQCRKLFHARVNFFHEASRENQERWSNMNIVDKGNLLWCIPDEDEEDFESIIRISEQFYDAIITGSVPLRYDALTALRKSPLAIDIYAWATYKSFTLSKSKKKSQFIPWDQFAEQLGADYTTVRNFAHKGKLTIDRVKTVFPELSIEYDRGGFVITGTVPSVKQKD